MRQTPRPPISAHRVARFEAWARLWLIWFVGVCVAWWSSGERADARVLDRVARGIGALVLNHAALRVRPHTLPRTRNRHGRLNRVRLRALIGSRLRRALKGRHGPQRLAAILAVMRDLERHVSRLARRLCRGLTRLRVIDLAPEHVPPIPALPARIAARDSS